MPDNESISVARSNTPETPSGTGKSEAEKGPVRSEEDLGGRGRDLRAGFGYLQPVYTARALLAIPRSSPRKRRRCAEANAVFHRYRTPLSACYPSRAGVADLYGDGIFIRNFGLPLANFLLPVQPFCDALGAEERICEGKSRKFSSNFSVSLVSDSFVFLILSEFRSRLCSFRLSNRTKYVCDKAICG